MLYGLYLSAAGALAESARNDIIANNIANINTTGFKDDLAVVRARLAEADEKSIPAFATPLDAMGGGLLISEVHTRHAQGPITLTGEPLDLAISGPGFFPVTDNSNLYYTRAGSFRRDLSGRLVTPDGRGFLATRTGRPITVPLEGDLAIAQDGLISIDGAPVAKIDLTVFRDPSALSKVGDSLYANRAGLREEPNGVGLIKQGALESSSVSPASELAKMITAMRGYEANMQLIRMQDQSLGEVIGIARVAI